jgi:hypothetical protein
MVIKLKLNEFRIDLRQDGLKLYVFLSLIFKPVHEISSYLFKAIDCLSIDATNQL